MSIKKCCICGLSGNGIMLKGKKICLKCEKNIVLSDINKEMYKFYVCEIRKILFY